MERKEVFIRITSSQEYPMLYAPAAYATMRVQGGQVYRITMTDEELKALLESGGCEIAQPGTFSTFNALTHSTARVGNGYAWQQQAV